MPTKKALIVQTLREEIASGMLPRGTRLQQDELARRFDTSTTPVREALRQLEEARLVVGAAHRGVTVASPDTDEVTSMYVILRLLEPYAARRAASRMSRRDFALLEKTNGQFADALARGDGPAAWCLDEQFHFHVYRQCGLNALCEELRRLWSAFPWASVTTGEGSGDGAAHEHARMLDALVRGDDQAVQRLFEQHVRHGFEALAAHIGHDSGDDPFRLDDL